MLFELKTGPIACRLGSQILGRFNRAYFAACALCGVVWCGVLCPSRLDEKQLIERVARGARFVELPAPFRPTVHSVSQIGDLMGPCHPWPSLLHDR
jgi:hypothetical protein